MAFSLEMYPWIYSAKFDSGSWIEEFIEQAHLSPEKEAQLCDEERSKLLGSRNSFSKFPLVNYTTQYGLGCFEGMKAFPQKDGSLKLFRPDENGARFKRSMEGLRMPGFPVDLFLSSSIEVVRRNMELGFYPKYDSEWEKDSYRSGHSIYLRPFTYSEAGIGVNLSFNPWVITVATPVGAYFKADNSKAVTSDRIRATKNGTGWIKCNSNYVISTLAKKEAEEKGFMETIFLDSENRKFIEEGSSCNIFFLLKDGTLVTPALGDTVLPGITRKSVITLAKDFGVKVEERKISIDEAMSESKECFVSGTAAGVSHIESLTHNGKCSEFGSEIGDFAFEMLRTLKGIQYGTVEDKYNWMFEV